MFANKNILLGVTGSIAAYKSAFLVREFVKLGANVRVVMTPTSVDFITPLTLSTLSKNPVLVDFANRSDGSWNNHIELGMWADYFVIAPASANTIAKMANGMCDNLLLAVYLSAKCPVFVAPAMDLDMYSHPTTKANIKKLISYKNIIIPVGNGELASGLVGDGRMAEPQEIVTQITNLCYTKLQKKRILITAGPTYEPLDPVRFIGNHSSGKMGFAIAEEAAKQGAEVVLICGPNNLKTISKNIKRVDITTALEMFEVCIKEFPKSDIAVLSAAVADFKPKQFSKNKIKKEKNITEIELEPTKDILSELGKLKTKNQLLIGFALETENEIENAKIKIQKKNLDMIVLNSLNDKGAGFKNDTNKITIIDKNNPDKSGQKFELKSKQEVAKDILEKIKLSL